MGYILIEKKAVIEPNPFKWAAWMETANRVVEQTVVGNGVKVSTVFLGLDHSISYEEEPILFETMIFGGHRDGETYRYTTWEFAKFGHDKIIKEFTERCSYCGTLRLADNINCVKCGAPF